MLWHMCPTYILTAHLLHENVKAQTKTHDCVCTKLRQPPQLTQDCTRSTVALAILPSQPGIEISVVCNGAVLQEYENDENKEDEHNPTVVTKYIEATSGMDFGIRWHISPLWPQHSIPL